MAYEPMPRHLCFHFKDWINKSTMICTLWLKQNKNKASLFWAELPDVMREISNQIYENKLQRSHSTQEHLIFIRYLKITDLQAHNASQCDLQAHKLVDLLFKKVTITRNKISKKL